MNNAWHSKILRLAATHNPSSDDDWTTTETLRTDLRDFLGSPPIHGIDPALFDRIADWKLRRQRARTEKHRKMINPEMLASITRCAFDLTHTDTRCLAIVRLRVLSSLPGVGPGM